MTASTTGRRDHRAAVHVEVKRAFREFFGNNGEDPVIDEHLANVDDNLGRDSGPILAAGALAAGFTIELDPPQVRPPEVVNPQDALDQGILARNDRLVVPTIVDMALEATSRNSRAFDEGIVVQVRELGL